MTPTPPSIPPPRGAPLESRPSLVPVPAYSRKRHTPRVIRVASYINTRVALFLLGPDPLQGFPLSASEPAVFTVTVSSGFLSGLNLAEVTQMFIDNNDHKKAKGSSFAAHK